MCKKFLYVVWRHFFFKLQLIAHVTLLSLVYLSVSLTTYYYSILKTWCLHILTLLHNERHAPKGMDQLSSPLFSQPLEEMLSD
jgi:hypothetical protein